MNEGVEEVWYLVTADQAKDTDSLVGKRNRVKARRMEGWVDHSFWDNLERYRS